MTFDFLDRVAASRPRPRPIFKAFRTRLVMNEDARQAFFPSTDKVLLAYDPDTSHLAVKALAPDVQEHAGWQAFHIERQPRSSDSYHVDWRPFWDREVGRMGGRPVVRGEEAIQRYGEDVIAMSLA